MPALLTPRNVAVPLGLVPALNVGGVAGGAPTATFSPP